MDGYLTTADLAARLGIKPTSVHRMRSRGDLPEPDAMAGRSPVWKVATIDAWQVTRPGHGWRKAAGPEDQVDPAPELEEAPSVQPLPSGDLYFDGAQITVGGVPLGPGRYALGDTGAELHVVPMDDDDLDD